MNRLVTLLLASLVLVGCSGNLSNWKIESAIEQCELNGGVDYIIVEHTNVAYVVCINGFGKIIYKEAD